LRSCGSRCFKHAAGFVRYNRGMDAISNILHLILNFLLQFLTLIVTFFISILNLVLDFARSLVGAV
jgi:hypothetical protein